ncbi:hypothetical protein HXX76_016244 [Chlamydomonas incerta]|uniref:Elp3/MiaA/NifB-like radical SAM core domain-containing protein n=1 Tax=Chlamydomonas incerta TaxID=51695 RepID=A0A835SKR9_CHLIN|nr:hypothetical protein HXX76_016244 [Chlamydomonas incerta]|eukprot:KAG2422165.1 hypothetical protein HXX76_016244 [Chlamydomonas incerta]
MMPVTPAIVPGPAAPGSLGGGGTPPAGAPAAAAAPSMVAGRLAPLTALAARLSAAEASPARLPPEALRGVGCAEAEPPPAAAAAAAASSLASLAAAADSRAASAGQGGEARLVALHRDRPGGVHVVGLDSITNISLGLCRAGARRYLIRIETSNPELYAALHPEPMSWHTRVECLRNLKKAGYMLGTGVMVGLPGQTLHDLAGDVMFFRDVKADMIGMGPFITQPGTPATDKWTALYPNANKNSHMKSMFDLCTAMNALVRITMGNVNISATTALQAIIPTGREIALERGANVVMPILTPTQYRESYQLYEGKPCITDTAVQCRRCLDMRLHSVGKTSAAGVWGDPASFLHPIVGVPVPHDLASPALAAAASADFHEEGAGPWNPIRLERLVEVPDRYPDPDNHGRKKAGAGKGSKAHDSHDDGDDHHHGAAAAGAAPSKAAAAAIGAAGAARGQRVAGAAASSARLCAGARRAGRVVASPLRPAAAVACRGAAVKAAAAAGEGAGGGAGSNIVASPGIASTTANGVPRINIGVFGVMNAGKSTLVNALAQQEACIVDSTPGTTADVKTVLLELHALGPAKLLDTAGLDEMGGLGDKKRRKALNSLKECDVAVLVVDTDTAAAAIKSGRLAEALEWETKVMEQAHKYNVSPVLLLNVKSKGLPEAQAAAMLEQVAGVLDPSKQIPRMSLDLASTPLHERSNITSAFVKEGAVRSSRYGAPLPGCLPRWSLGRNAMLLMVIPMDAETPGGRLLRPQAQVMEEAIRHWATVLSVRLDLDAARGKLGPEAREMERQRFGGVIAMMEKNDGPTLVVTDSQAIDVVHPWTLDRASGRSLVPITTFSIAMAYQQNGGRLDPFVEGLEALETLKEGDRVLISEACNHNRITSACNDIGMVQIPNKLEAALGGKKLQIEHAFGREFPELESGGMDGLKLAIHCGGCMIDAQKMQQRMKDLHEAGVPVTNYGVFFSWAAWPDALRRALEPWGVEPPVGTPATPAAAPATAGSV